MKTVNNNPIPTTNSEKLCNSNSAYVNNVGDTTFIIQNSFTGAKSLTDAFEEIIISTFRHRNAMPTNAFSQ
jgi:hypothetical protein